MTAKEYLKQYEYAVQRITRLEAELREETILIDAVKSLSDNDGMPHGNGIIKPTEEKAIRLADKTKRLIDAKKEAVEIRREVFDFVESIPGVEGDVLFLRYVQLERWTEIADKLSYSLPGVYSIHSRAIELVEKSLPERVRHEE